MSVLVDTSVWVAHFRKTNGELVDLLAKDQVLTHPMVIVEVACGTPPAPRATTLTHLSLLQRSHLAGWNDVMAFVERERLYGLACGLVDMTLLASTLITPGATLWTLDKRLLVLAERLRIAHRPLLH